MKGFKPVWIIIALLLAIIILAVMITLANRGKDTAKTSFSQTDLINCCNNCCITVANGGTAASTTCPGNIPISQIEADTGISVTSCSADIPFCECPATE